MYCQSSASISYCGVQLSLVKMTHLCTFRRVLIFQYSLLKLLFFLIYSCDSVPAIAGTTVPVALNSVPLILPPLYAVL